MIIPSRNDKMADVFIDIIMKIMDSLRVIYMNSIKNQLSEQYSGRKIIMNYIK